MRKYIFNILQLVILIWIFKDYNAVADCMERPQVRKELSETNLRLHDDHYKTLEIREGDLTVDFGYNPKRLNQWEILMQTPYVDWKELYRADVEHMNECVAIAIMMCEKAELTGEMLMHCERTLQQMEVVCATNTKGFTTNARIDIAESYNRIKKRLDLPEANSLSTKGKEGLLKGAPQVPGNFIEQILRRSVDQKSYITDSQESFDVHSQRSQRPEKSMDLKKTNTLKTELTQVYIDHLKACEKIDAKYQTTLSDTTTGENNLSKEIEEAKIRLNRYKQEYAELQKVKEKELTQNIQKIEELETEMEKRNKEITPIETAVEKNKDNLHKVAERVYEAWEKYVTKKNVKKALVITSVIGTAVMACRYLQINPIKQSWNWGKVLYNNLVNSAPKAIENVKVTEQVGPVSNPQNAVNTVGFVNKPLTTAANAVENAMKDKTAADKATYGLLAGLLARNAMRAFVKFKK